MSLALLADDAIHLIDPIAQTHLASSRNELLDHVVVYGNVSRNLISNVHVVTLVGQTHKRATHRDHVVVGVWREDNHTLGIGCSAFGTGRVVGIWFATRPARNCMLQIVEYLDVDRVERTFGFEQLSQRVVDIIVIGQFENRLLGLHRQPDHRFANELRRPVARANQPRSLDAGQLYGGLFVHYDLDVLMTLQVGCGTHRVDCALDHLTDYRGFIFAPSYQYDLFCGQDRTDTHCDSLRRNVLGTCEGRGLLLDTCIAQRDHTGLAVRVRSRFVEADLTLRSHTEQHQVHTAHFGDFGLIVATVLRNLLHGHRRIGDKGVLGTHIDILQKLLVDTEVTALLCLLRNTVELVEREYHYVAETRLARAEHLDQLRVDTYG